MYKRVDNLLEKKLFILIIIGTYLKSNNYVFEKVFDFKITWVKRRGLKMYHIHLFSSKKYSFKLGSPYFFLNKRIRLF